MSASIKPLQRQPVTARPVPLNEWQRGQTIGQFFETLRARGYVIARGAAGYLMVRTH